MGLAGFLVAARVARRTVGEGAGLARLRGALCESQPLEGGETLGRKRILVTSSATGSGRDIKRGIGWSVADDCGTIDHLLFLS